MKKHLLVMIILLTASILIAFVIPIVLVIAVFHNSTPLTFLPIGFILAIGLSVAGVWYYFIERRNDSQKS